MKKIINLVLLQLIFTSFLSIAQEGEDLNIKWSSRFESSNFKEGFFDRFVGASDRYVYGISTDLESRLLPKKRNEFAVFLVAFDKNNMQRVFHTELRGKTDKSRRDKMRMFVFHSALVMNGKVLVFWKKSSNTQSEIHVEIFDEVLNREGKLKRIYTVKHGAKKSKNKILRKSKYSILSGVPIQIQENPGVEQNFLISAEIQKGKEEPFEVDYLVLNADLTELAKGHVSLPIIQTNKPSTEAASMSYVYGQDGKIYIKSLIQLRKAEIRALPPGESSTFSVLNIVDPATAGLETHTIRYDGKNVFNFDLITNEQGVKIYGFFTDLAKGSPNSGTHGIFSATINGEQEAEPQFSYFDKETLDELFKADPSEQKLIESKRKQRKRKKNKKNQVDDNESLDEHYVIECAKNVDKDHIVLFCSKAFNYTVRNCDANGNCVENKYCRKSNVTAFKLNNEGEIVWASNVDRSITYGGWNVKDLKVIEKDGKMIVVYGSSYTKDADKRSGLRAKKRKELREKFEYAVIDVQTGTNEKKEAVMNLPKTKKKNLKMINPRNIQTFDNAFYINSTTIKFRFSSILGATAIESVPIIATAFFLPAVFLVPSVVATSCVVYYFYARGYVYKGGGHVGKIELK